jgi:hypothetical protein
MFEDNSEDGKVEYGTVGGLALKAVSAYRQSGEVDKAELGKEIVSGFMSGNSEAKNEKTSSSVGFHRAKFVDGVC